MDNQVNAIQEIIETIDPELVENKMKLVGIISGTESSGTIPGASINVEGVVGSLGIMSGYSNDMDNNNALINIAKDLENAPNAYAYGMHILYAF